MEVKNLRTTLVETALAWEKSFGNAPSITSALSEYDAALLVGCSTDEYSKCMQGSPVVQRGYDFLFNGYQESWEWDRESYISSFDSLKRLSPNDYRNGMILYIKE